MAGINDTLGRSWNCEVLYTFCFGMERHCGIVADMLVICTILYRSLICDCSRSEKRGCATFLLEVTLFFAIAEGLNDCKVIHIFTLQVKLLKYCF